VNGLYEAVILVGGKGTRLQSVVSDRPKVLAAVNGRPFLAYLLDQIAAAGISHTVLCVGYHGEQVQAAFGEAYAGMCLSYSQEITLLGTGGALHLALPLIASEAFIAMNGDSFCEMNLTDLWVWHHARQANATLVLTPKSDTARYGRVSLSADGVISGFEEKGSTAGAGWVNAGIYVFNAEMVRAIPAGHVVSLEHDVFPGWVGQRLYGYQSQGRFLDIGTPESYAEADALFAKDRKK
jgi:NDP-sugar pyrophosphorylase family protein